MRILALELSTETGSLALLDGDTVIWEKTWIGEGRQRRPIFPDLNALVSTEAWDWSRIDRFAVGVGPGAFSGLRMAVSGVMGMALPDNKPVMAVSSACALAGSILKETGANQVVVLGDARRNELWAGCFKISDRLVSRDGDWIVSAVEHLPDSLKKTGTVWVSPDWARIQGVLTSACPAGVSLIQEPRIPGAAMVARLVAGRVDSGMEGESLTPIYVHPAVSVAPRF
ncbi:MAG: tRNA (adenosine(37)-N6)-threonylcarbamoyltransferase complex dimerization subunit type 1 TsaB [bacterium]